jgi:hypothetical protein
MKTFICRTLSIFAPLMMTCGTEIGNQNLVNLFIFLVWVQIIFGAVLIVALANKGEAQEIITKTKRNNAAAAVVDIPAILVLGYYGHFVAATAFAIVVFLIYVFLEEAKKSVNSEEKSA